MNQFVQHYVKHLKTASLGSFASAYMDNARDGLRSAKELIQYGAQYPGEVKESLGKGFGQVGSVLQAGKDNLSANLLDIATHPVQSAKAAPGFARDVFVHPPINAFEGARDATQNVIDGEPWKANALKSLGGAAMNIGNGFGVSKVLGAGTVSSKVIPAMGIIGRDLAERKGMEMVMPPAEAQGAAGPTGEAGPTPVPTPVRISGDVAGDQAKLQAPVNQPNWNPEPPKATPPESAAPTPGPLKVDPPAPTAPAPGKSLMPYAGWIAGGLATGGLLAWTKNHFEQKQREEQKRKQHPLAQRYPSLYGSSRI